MMRDAVYYYQVNQVKQCLRGLEDPRGHVALVVLNKVWVDAFESTQSSTKYIYV